MFPLRYQFSPVLRKGRIILLSASLWKVRSLLRQRKNTNPKVMMMDTHLLFMTLLQEESSILVQSNKLEKKTEIAPAKKRLI